MDANPIHTAGTGSRSVEELIRRNRALLAEAEEARAAALERLERAERQREAAQAMCQVAQVLRASARALWRD